MRLLVTGSRDWADENRMFLVLAATLGEWAEKLIEAGVSDWSDPQYYVLVSGNARGADRMAERLWEEQFRCPVERHPAKWNVYGRAAGYYRNEEMVSAGANACLAFLMPCSKLDCRIKTQHFSHGAEGCVKLALSAGIPVTRYEHTKEKTNG